MRGPSVFDRRFPSDGPKVVWMQVILRKEHTFAWAQGAPNRLRKMGARNGAAGTWRSGVEGVLETGQPEHSALRIALNLLDEDFGNSCNISKAPPYTFASSCAILWQLCRPFLSGDEWSCPTQIVDRRMRNQQFVPTEKPFS